MLNLIKSFKEYFVFLLFVFGYNISACSQNLILNPGFEDHYSKIVDNNRIIRSSWIDTLPALFWYDLNRATPDYLNRGDILQDCYSFQVFKEIYPDLFNEEAVYDGQGAMGICAYNVSGGLEHITGIIESPLIKDSTYRVSMDISLVDFSYICLTNIGILLTLDFPNELMVEGGFYDEIFQSPIQSSIDFDISSTCCCTGLVTVHGEFKATGGEKYITIGLFYQEDYNLFPVIDKFRWIQSKGKKYEKKVLNKYSETPVYKINRNFQPNDFSLAKQAYYVIDNVIMTLK